MKAVLFLSKTPAARWGLICLWVVFLATPFTGIGKALIMAGLAGAALLLARGLKTGAALAVMDSALRVVVRARDALQPLRTAAPPRVVSAVFLLLLLFIPHQLNDYYRDVLTLTGMYVVLALGLNIIVGQAGLLHLGSAAFYAVGAYAYAILSTRWGLPFWPGLVIGASASALFALMIGLATLRLRGDYFAIVTLACGEITRIVLNNWDGMTGGPNGIADIGRPVLAGFTISSTLGYYYLILLIAVLTIFAMRRLMASRVGRAWLVIKEDAIAAEAMGIDTFRLKLLAFVLGSAWAGLAGVFFAGKMAFVSPESFSFFESVLVLCMVVLGGMGSIPGIILGAFLLITLPEVFRDFQDYRMLAFGFALVLMMIFRPQGLLGKAKSAT